MVDFGKVLYNWVVLHGPNIILSILTLIIGLWVIRFIQSSVAKKLQRRNIDASLRPFLVSLTSVLLKTMLVLSVMGMLGIEMTSFIAVLGAVGLAIGLALSGTLQNFAGGVILLIFKPFKVGDVIDAQGYIGAVSEIQIFNTILKTADNKTIIIPNGGLSTGSMTNYSTEPLRRVDWTFGIAYGDDAEVARGCLQELMNNDQRILKDPQPFVAISALADSSVNFTTRAWVKSEDYWEVFFDMNEKVYKTFTSKGLNIPFPQMDVHLHNNS